LLGGDSNEIKLFYNSKNKKLIEKINKQTTEKPQKSIFENSIVNENDIKSENEITDKQSKKKK